MATTTCSASCTHTTLSKLKTEESDQPLFVWTTFSEKLLAVKASDGACTWQGTLSGQQLKTLAELSKMSLGPFIDETVKALSGASIGDPSFVYSATPAEAGGLELTWKKLSDGVKFQLGSINLIPAPNQSINCLLLNHSLDCVNDLELKVKELEGECGRLTRERQTALAHLKSCSSELEAIESELHGKFKLILNEKKAKIRKLMESKAYLVDQNEEMQRQIWETRTGAQPSTESESKTKQQSTNKSSVKEKTPPNYQSGVESLLCDAPCKPPSPPPTKRRLLSKGTKKGQIEIPQPPPLELHTANKTKKATKMDTEMSLDSNELLDML